LRVGKGGTFIGRPQTALSLATPLLFLIGYCDKDPFWSAKRSAAKEYKDTTVSHLHRSPAQQALNKVIQVSEQSSSRLQLLFTHDLSMRNSTLEARHCTIAQSCSCYTCSSKRLVIACRSIHVTCQWYRLGITSACASTSICTYCTPIQ